jgi:hypothetical protein
VEYIQLFFIKSVNMGNQCSCSGQNNEEGEIIVGRVKLTHIHCL